MKKITGFSLVEILVVATIIGLLTVVGVTSYSQLGKNSRDARRKADVEQVRAALEMYKSNSANSNYPLAITDLTDYLRATPVDPRGPTPLITYSPLPAGCDNLNDYCTNYTVSCLLENGDVYQTDPYGGSVATVSPAGISPTQVIITPSEIP